MPRGQFVVEGFAFLSSSSADEDAQESDKIGAYVKDNPVRPQDLGATIYHALDVPLETRLGKDGGSRPITTGEPIKDLFS